MTKHLLSFLIVSFAFASVASADIIFGSGNSPATDNIGSYVQQTSTTATGQKLGGVDDVFLAMSDTPLFVPSSGAARIEAVGTLFTKVMYSPLGFYFDIFEMNVQNDSTTGTFVLRAVDDSLTEFVSAPFTLGSGENRVWAQAINGQYIRKITVEASGALIKDIRQVRITQSAVAVPEPASIGLAGLGMAGLAIMQVVRRRRRQAA
jgi:hypothetical protein